jgi:hypothetical protein
MTKPLEYSKRGDNTLTVNCSVYGGHRHYAVCLNLIERIEKRDYQSKDAACIRAFNCGGCPAKKMRSEERQAGHALFYTPREPTPATGGRPKPAVDVLSPSFQRGWDRAGLAIAAIKRRESGLPEPVETAPRPERSAPVSRPTRRPARVEPQVSTGNLYADLVNKMMAEQAKDK